MEWYSIPELAREIGTSGNTVRRYIKRFPDFFQSKTFGGVDKFQADTLDALKFIFNQYNHQGKTRGQIEQKLRLKYGHTIPIMQPDLPVNELVLKYGSNTQDTPFPAIIPEITRMADSFERIALALENQNIGAGPQTAVTESQSIQNKELLTDNETASFLGVADRTLRDWRKQKKGPAFVQMGSKIRYRKKDIDDYLDNQTIKSKN